MKPIAFGALLVACSCAPLTYSEEGAVDFQTYASVRVSVMSTIPVGDPAGYLVDELRRSSGFTTVTLDPAAPVDAVLGVNLRVTYSTSIDAEGQSADGYDAAADYALTAGTSRVDSGQATAAHSNELDAALGALDGVVTHYIAPYRL